MHLLFIINIPKYMNLPHFQAIF